MVGTAVLLATIGVLVKQIGHDVPYMTLAFLRVFLGFIFLLITVPAFDKNAFQVTAGDLKEYAAIGLLMSVSLSAYTISHLFTEVQNAVLLHYSYPFFVFIFAAIFLKERFTRKKMITLALAFIAIIIINPFHMNEGVIGNSLAFGSAILFGLLVTMMRKVDQTHGIGDVMWFLFFASLFLAPFPFVYGFGNAMDYSSHIILLGFFSTGLVYLFYNLALEELEADIAAVISMIVTPLVSIALAYFLLFEPLSIRIAVGGLILIAAGIFLEFSTKEQVVSPNIVKEKIS